MKAHSIICKLVITAMLLQSTGTALAAQKKCPADFAYLESNENALAKASQLDLSVMDLNSSETQEILADTTAASELVLKKPFQKAVAEYLTELRGYKNERDAKANWRIDQDSLKLTDPNGESPAVLKEADQIIAKLKVDFPKYDYGNKGASVKVTESTQKYGIKPDEYHELSAVLNSMNPRQQEILQYAVVSQLRAPGGSFEKAVLKEIKSLKPTKSPKPKMKMNDRLKVMLIVASVALSGGLGLAGFTVIHPQLGQTITQDQQLIRDKIDAIINYNHDHGNVLSDFASNFKIFKDLLKITLQEHMSADTYLYMLDKMPNDNRFNYFHDEDLNNTGFRGQWNPIVVVSTRGLASIPIGSISAEQVKTLRDRYTDKIRNSVQFVDRDVATNLLEQVDAELDSLQKK